MFVYSNMAIAAGIGLIWRMKLAHAVAAASAPIGAWFTFCALATGSLWGKPMWGTWWVWDARLTSELILLFLYLGFIALRSSIEDPQRADRAAAVLALVGVINLPIIHYSVVWWNSLHQGSTMFNPGAMSIEMKWPALAMLFGFMLYFGAVLFVRLRAEVIRRERNATWLKEELAR
jgi:heme exporter protein C